MAIERTFSIIKPDATARNVTGGINAVIEKAGLRIVAQKRVRWTMAQAQEFYADTGAGVSDKPRTLFAVGDEKQSIYSFQGAAPKMFADTGRRFAEISGLARRPWRTVPLTLSFRSVAPLLAAVDRVFADPGAGVALRGALLAVATPPLSIP